MSRIPVVRLGFSRGVKRGYAPHTIPTDSLWEARNADIDEVGVLTCRPGTEVKTAPLGNGKVQGFASAFDTLIKCWNQSLYKLVDGAWTAIREAFLGAAATDQVNIIKWTSGGAEIVYLQAGNGLWSSDGTSCSLVTPYVPGAGESVNLLRAGDGSQDLTSGPAKAKIGLLRPGLSTRMAVAYGNDVFLSAPSDPSYFPSDQIIHLPDINGEEITGLEVHYETLIIYRGRDTWAFFGKDVSDSGASLVRQDGSVGCVASRTLAQLPGFGLIGLGQDNVYLLSQPTAIEGQKVMLPIGGDILPYLKQAMTDGYADACGYYWDNQYWLSFPSAVEPERNFRLRVIKTPEGEQILAWFVDTGPPAVQYAEHGEKLYLASPTQGQLKHYDPDLLTDSGEDIPFMAVTRHEMLGLAPGKVKKVFLLAAGTKTLQHLSTSLIVDGQNIETVEFNLAATAGSDFTIGESAIEVSRIGRLHQLRAYEARARAKGQFLQISISGTSPGEKIGIAGYAFEYKPKRRVKGITEGVSVS